MSTNKSIAAFWHSYTLGSGTPKRLTGKSVPLGPAIIREHLAPCPKCGQPRFLAQAEESVL